MSPLERVIPVKEIAKIRVECNECHTVVSFTLRGWTHGNIGTECPFCHKSWGELVERIFLDLTKSMERNADVKGAVISLETEEAF